MNIHEFFGVDSAEIFEENEAAEGYLLGCEVATSIQHLVLEDFSNRSKAFREAVLNALRDQL